MIAAGLDQDFRRLPFGPMPELLAHAEFVDKLQAVCHRCGGGATTTQRLVDGRPAPYSGATIVVGANEQYEARCRDCHEAGQEKPVQPSRQSPRSAAGALAQPVGLAGRRGPPRGRLLVDPTALFIAIIASSAAS